MSLTLRDYLKAAAKKPFVWGQFDCCLFAADWVLAKHGIDPMIEFRGIYKSASDAALLINGAGCMEKAADAFLSHYGFYETKRPETGDIGIVITHKGDTFGIKTQAEHMWACKGPRGVVVAPFELLKAWKV